MSITTKNPVCVDSLKLLGDFWTMMIVDKLSDGPLRFRDLENQIDSVNTATLTSRLKSMQAMNLITRNEQSRADVTYQLTEMGEKVIPVLNAVNDFSAYAKKHKN
jgi:DNA-binding HxlR family transcriptional regulator